MKKKDQIGCGSMVPYELSQLKRLYDERNRNGMGIGAAEAMTILRQYYDLQEINEQLTQDVFGSQFTEFISYEQFLNYVTGVRKRLQIEAAPKSRVFGVFVANSLLMLKDGKIQIEKSEEKALPTYEIPAELQEYLSENFKKPYGLVGLLNEKAEVPTANHYYYNQFVVGQVEKFDASEKYIEDDRKFARSVFDFDFEKACNVLAESSLASTKDAMALLNIFNTMKLINDEVCDDKNLKKLFLQRTGFDINGEYLYKKMSSENEKERSTSTAKNSAGRFKMLKSKFEFVVELCSSVWREIQNPYLKAACIFMSNKENRVDKPYDEVLLLSDISVRDRFTFAKRFLNIEQYSKFKERMREEALASHKLESIMVFGKEQESEVVLQNYMDYTLDVETVAILSVYFRILKFNSTLTPAKITKYEHFISVYKRMMDRLARDKMRMEFERKCEQIEKEFKGKSQSSNMTYVFKCDNCGTSLTQKILLKLIDPKKRTFAKFAKEAKERFTQCSQCTELLPRCCICLLQITIKNPYTEYDPQRSRKVQPDEGVGADTAIVWCQKCKHGGHMEHMTDWFSAETRCPVSQCECNCVEKPL